MMAEKPEDLSLPASVVARIIKDALPDGVNVSKEARTAIGKAASVFVLYTTACSNNFALKGKRKTLTAADVFSALEDMEFGQFIPELKECLEGYKQDQKEKKEAAADRRKKQQPSTTNTTAPFTIDHQSSSQSLSATTHNSSSDSQERASVSAQPTTSPSVATGQQEGHSEMTAMDTST